MHAFFSEESTTNSKSDNSFRASPPERLKSASSSSRVMAYFFNSVSLAPALVKSLNRLRPKVVRQRFGARQKCIDDLKAWVFGGSANEGHIAFFNSAKKGVLLGLAKAVNFIDKQKRSFVGEKSPRLFCFFNDLAHLFHPKWIADKL